MLYRRLASLNEYVLVNPQSKSIEASVRGTDGLFVLHDMSEDDAILYRSVEVKVPVSAVLRGAGPEGD